jgi:hypothetical protein
MILLSKSASYFIYSAGEMSSTPKKCKLFSIEDDLPQLYLFQTKENKFF